MVNWIKPSELPDNFHGDVWVCSVNGSPFPNRVVKYHNGEVWHFCSGYQLMKDSIFRVAIIETPETPIFD